MRFSIITVSYNPGEKLHGTLCSVAAQTFTDYEVIVKDGGSTDGSTDFLKAPEEEGLNRVRFYEEKDKGIYDAMNRAVGYATGEYVLFLNCGDLLADENVLERVNEVIERTEHDEAGECKAQSAPENFGETGTRRYVFYGDTFSEQTKVTIASAPEITGFTCYRNIPCHQSCFYSMELCREKPYDLSYKIRADYDHFLWCFYRGNAGFVHMAFPVSSYEGGGYSESSENRQRDAQEHRQITSTYMKGTELFRYRAVMALTLAPVRRRMAESKALSGLYHRLKSALYKGKD